MQLGHALPAWSNEIVAMWRFICNNGITEGLHNKMELISRQAYGFHNLASQQATPLPIWAAPKSF